MSNAVFVLAQTYSALLERGFTEEIVETIRDEFQYYKSGNEFDHEWFCHDRGADPGSYLSHVHLIPSNPEDEATWLADFENKHKRRHRSSDRYVLYASDPRHGYLIIDILDDPGAHEVWKQRRTKLAGYELAATDFCTFGPKPDLHR
ncbi:type II toxin-antitoxin system YafO family toxin [Massilia rubra]|uniref:Uncharacterized protein n=1 Tax=Massilia rubra TaxID=2607910 RepID=A0ABX0LXA3_9BURK|nr:type II toxin-antitoxin system YafO family toxin [Massilia rubra]NHZ36019.1 hypothetical protein [Massilia rubra]